MKNNKINKILVLGSGPIIIGQAAEFDYSGVQCCLSLKEEGYEVVLINSNPATIMTDKEIADKVYMEPLKYEFVAKIIRKERPDGIIGSIGGQTGLNLLMELDQKGVLDECEVEVLGTDLSVINKAEDREQFKELCLEINEPIIQSEIANNLEEAKLVVEKIGFPIILRPAFTLGGSGGGFVEEKKDFEELVNKALNASPTHQVLVEKSIKGFKEVEYEVIRDKNGNKIIVCNMENINPVGIHTGDSAVVAPSQTLTNQEYQMLRNSSLNIIESLKIEGGCNVQFALDPYSSQYYVIEVNPRVSRSSALASKATGYPIAYVSAKVAIGKTLEEIQLKNTPACFEPALDYVVTKLARFPFDKFESANRKLSTQMKATGEVMAIGRNFEESFLKAIASLENDYDYITFDKEFNNEDILKEIEQGDDRQLYLIADALRNGVTINQIFDITKIDIFFLNKINNIIKYEKVINENDLSKEILLKAKKLGISDSKIGELKELDALEVRKIRENYEIKPVFKMIDSSSAEFDSYIPYFYQTYEEENESVVTNNKKIILIGSGPIRIGQGVEFDYSTTHAIKTLRENGYEAILINSNPETVSTDYTISDKLYFEPLKLEYILNVIEYEKPQGVILSLGGQTPINLADDLHKLGINILGTTSQAIDECENRDLFEEKLEKLKIKRPQGQTVFSIEQGIEVANNLTYPVLIRPSFVLGGRAMRIIYNEEELTTYLTTAVKINKKHPVLIDKYIVGKELEVDALSDGKSIFIPGIMEHIEKTGVHSGDSISVYPTFTISDKVKEEIVNITEKIGIEFKIQGVYNIQFIVDDKDDVYIIEVNPRASRTVPFISKVVGYNLAKYTVKIALGSTLEDLGLTDKIAKERKDKYFVKVPTFSFNKIEGLDTFLTPEMKSTGEAIGIDKTLNKALYKGLIASNLKLSDSGTVFISVDNEDKKKSLEVAKRFNELGFNLIGTKNTANYLSENNIKVKEVGKISTGDETIVSLIKKQYIKYIINTGEEKTLSSKNDGFVIRTTAAINNIPTFTSFETINVVLNVLEERSIDVDCM